MKLFEPEIKLAMEDLDEDNNDGEITMDESFNFEGHINGLNTAFEDLAGLYKLQETICIHPISPVSEKLGFIALENHHRYYNLQAEGISLENIQVAVEGKGGFLDAIASVIAAIWKAIKIMFKNIWKFFKKLFGFKTNAKKKKQKLKDQQKEADNAAKQKAEQNKEKAEQNQEPIKNPEPEIVKVEPEVSKPSPDIKEGPDEILAPEVQEKFDNAKTDDEIKELANKELMNKVMSTMADHPLGFLLLSTHQSVDEEIFQKALTLGMNNLAIFNAVMERVYNGVEQYLSKHNFTDKLNDNIVKQEYVNAFSLIADTNDHLYKGIFTVVPFPRRITLFEEAYKKSGLSEKYIAAPTQMEIGDIQSPYKGDHYMPFKAKQRMNDGVSIDCYEMIKGEHFNVETDVHAERDTLYLNQEALKNLLGDFNKLYDLYEEQKDTNEKKFHGIEKRVDVLIESLENILSEPTRIINEKLHQLEEAERYSINRGMSPWNPNMDNMGNDMTQLRADLEKFRKSKKYNNVIFALIKNNLQTLAVIFRHYSDYLVGMQKFLDFVFQCSSDSIEAFKNKTLASLNEG